MWNTIVNRTADQLQWMQEHPFGTFWVAMGTWVAAAGIGIAVWAVSTARDCAAMEAADRGEEFATSDEELSGYYKRIGDGIHWRP